MIKLLWALLGGIFALTVRRLGPTIILFAYIYISHMDSFRSLESNQYVLSPSALLVAFVILLGILSVAFKTTVTTLSSNLDRAAFPWLDKIVLAYVNKFDLTRPRLRSKSRAILEFLKVLLLFFVLCAICASFSLALSLCVALIFMVTALLAVYFGSHQAKSTTSWWMQKSVSNPDNYSEVILISGLILAFFFVVEKGGLLDGTILILVIARFGSTLRIAAANLMLLAKWHHEDSVFWNVQK